MTAATPNPMARAPSPFRYAAMLVSFLLERVGKPVGWLYAPYYFTLINVASAHAFLKFVAGRKQVLWTPRKG